MLFLFFCLIDHLLSLPSHLTIVWSNIFMGNFLMLSSSCLYLFIYLINSCSFIIIILIIYPFIINYLDLLSRLSFLILKFIIFPDLIIITYCIYTIQFFFLGTLLPFKRSFLSVHLLYKYVDHIFL